MNTLTQALGGLLVLAFVAALWITSGKLIERICGRPRPQLQALIALIILISPVILLVVLIYL